MNFTRVTRLAAGSRVSMGRNHPYATYKAQCAWREWCRYDDNIERAMKALRGQAARDMPGTQEVPVAVVVNTMADDDAVQINVLFGWAAPKDLARARRGETAMDLVVPLQRGTRLIDVE